ncbi:MAG: GNAT family N-acetyltransferase [Longimicrobiales bacterium]
MQGSAHHELLLRPLRAEDAQALSLSFSAIGWTKPEAGFTKYLQEQEEGERWVRVAEVDEQAAGYVTLKWDSPDPVFQRLGVPELMDLNVLPPFRRRGIGTALIEAAEIEASRRGPTIGLRMGLHSGYGAAQRLYVRRGYLPDGAGAVLHGEVVAEGATVSLDDDLSLRLTRDVSGMRGTNGST